MSQDIAKKEAGSLPGYVPASDIVEMEDGFHILLDMPGVDRGDLIIDLKENEVTISGRSAYAPPEGAKLLHQEFGAGDYSRTFTLSDAVDRDKIKAVLNNGVLNLYLPKAEELKPRRIEIASE
jgi:HSP20 family molecular chaperone IbpA